MELVVSIEEIKANAPIGATHYCDDCLGFDYVRMIGNDMYIWDRIIEDWFFMKNLSYKHDFKPL